MLNYLYDQLFMFVYATNNLVLEPAVDIYFNYITLPKQYYLYYYDKYITYLNNCIIMINIHTYLNYYIIMINIHTYFNDYIIIMINILPTFSDMGISYVYR